MDGRGDRLPGGEKAVSLAAIRRRCGMTQRDLAARLGVTQSRVSTIEHAGPAVELRTLARYVRGLGGTLRIEILFEDETYVLVFDTEDR